MWFEIQRLDDWHAKARRFGLPAIQMDWDFAAFFAFPAFPGCGPVAYTATVASILSLRAPNSGQTSFPTFGSLSDLTTNDTLVVYCDMFVTVGTRPFHLGTPAMEGSEWSSSRRVTGD